MDEGFEAERKAPLPDQLVGAGVVELRLLLGTSEQEVYNGGTEQIVDVRSQYQQSTVFLDRCVEGRAHYLAHSFEALLKSPLLLRFLLGDGLSLPILTQSLPERVDELADLLVGNLHRHVLELLEVGLGVVLVLSGDLLVAGDVIEDEDVLDLEGFDLVLLDLHVVADEEGEVGLLILQLQIDALEEEVGVEAQRLLLVPRVVDVGELGRQDLLVELV
mmetsp:Transcript_14864/g.25316  ORF Transcript_14864/g.25316 Transcript_14864/m.25316 type:complete len:218 (-) Transcript_14864:48-701(-)